MSQMLGKRKEREEDGLVDTTHGYVDGRAHYNLITNGHPTSSATIFVSNLPYSATSTDLKTLFSDIGPVRSAFVVLDQDTSTSKGVGYVSFAIRDDAQLAVNKVSEGGEGIALDGRSLRVQWAGAKVRCFA